MHSCAVLTRNKNRLAMAMDAVYQSVNQSINTFIHHKRQTQNNRNKNTRKEKNRK